MNELDIRTIRRLIRRRRRREGMTLVEIMIVVIIMALIATGVAVAVMPQLERAKVRDTQTGVATMRSAVEMYLADSPGNECPSNADELVEGGFLNGSTRTVDAWDNEFHIECDGTDITVVSAGPDEQWDTEDDIR